MYVKQCKTVVADEKIIFRLLKKDDKKMLTDFFLSLSDEFKKWYNPHPFNEKAAIDICSNKDKRHKKVIGFCDKKIVAYCQLFFGLRHWEDVRFSKRNMFFVGSEVCTIAPCVAEDFQGKGVGLKMMQYIIDVCKQYNKKYILLWGGVVVKNKNAVKYYERLNFEKTRKWLHPVSRVMSYDMYLEV